MEIYSYITPKSFSIIEAIFTVF